MSLKKGGKKRARTKRWTDGGRARRSETEGVRMMRTAAERFDVGLGGALRVEGEGRGFPGPLGLWSHPQSLYFLRGLQKHPLLF